MNFGFNYKFALGGARRGGAPLPLFNDLFVDTPATAIASHTPAPIGTSWANTAWSQPGAAGVINASGDALTFTGTNTDLFGAVIAPNPTSADQRVTALLTNNGATNGSAIVVIGLRESNGATRDGYHFAVFNEKIELFRFITGAALLLDSWVITPVWGSSTVEVVAQVVGTALTLTFDGTERISATDGTHTDPGTIQAAGRKWAGATIDFEDFRVDEL